jgi:hypothetical protein
MCDPRKEQGCSTGEHTPDHPVVKDDRLRQLVPTRSVSFWRGEDVEVELSPLELHQMLVGTLL